MISSPWEHCATAPRPMPLYAQAAHACVRESVPAKNDRSRGILSCILSVRFMSYPRTTIKTTHSALHVFWRLPDWLGDNGTHLHVYVHTLLEINDCCACSLSCTLYAALYRRITDNMLMASDHVLILRRTQQLASASLAFRVSWFCSCKPC